jgi:Flp pilus assembly protein TadG
MTARFRASRVKATKGTIIIEFTFVALMLVLLIFWVVEMSRMVLVYDAIATAARAGARYAGVHGHDRAGGSGVDGESGPANNPAQVLTVVKNVASTSLLRLVDSNITVTYTPSNTAGSLVTVTVVYTYDPFVAYFRTSLNVQLSSTSQGVITF